MIGPAWRSRAVQAVLGPNRSPLVPQLWSGWLDSDGALIAMTGLPVAHEAFGPSDDGVANTVLVDCGVAGAGWVIAGVGLFDAETGGSLVVSAQLSAPNTPAEGDELTFAPGALKFVVGP